MALSLRQRQIDAVIRMLNLNHPVASGGTADEEVYKILLLDRFCRDIISPLLRVNDLRKHGITLHLMVDSDRQNIPDVPAVYFVQPTQNNIHRIVQDAARGVYDKFHLNFTSSLPRPLLEELASGTLKADCLQRVAKVFDQYIEFVCLESSLFSLAQPKAYVQLNDPTASDKQVESTIEGIVSGLFCVLVTLGVVPIIRCPEKGPAEMVARQLDARLRAHLASPNNLFKEAGHLATAYQRPLLCIFDRNLELAVGVQHSWTYRPLVHDILGLRLNRVMVQQGGGAAAAVMKTRNQTAYELDDSDAFWMTHNSSPFQKAAEEVDVELKKWKQDKEEVNKQPGVELEEDDMASNTQKLTAAMNAVPEMVERKRMIDKHINIGGALLEEIKSRAIDAFFSTEEDMMTRGTTDKTALLNLLRTRGTSEDKIRLAIVYLLASESVLPAELEAMETVLKEAQVDTSPLLYVKQLKRINQSLSSAYHAGGSKDDLLDWAKGIYGQGAKIVKERMQTLLSSGRQLVLTRAVDALMQGGSEAPEGYLLLDPRLSAGKSGMAAVGASAMQSLQARGGGAAFKDAIVFMIGGGNYVEYQGLQELREKGKSVIYGATEILSGREFVAQLGELGQKMAGGGGA
eukprot:TRINITY_DN367_c0_g1_i3.p1 TRINITY_DN367_c0_g1~~TRINITY_DN367_c0_g1_i3.p1  ORF type:complete len:648 (-),score=121.81 TRINITY_DN367_c0_g1_i3:918-2807(-)